MNHALINLFKCSDNQVCENKESYCDIVKPDCKLQKTRTHCAKYCGFCKGNSSFFDDTYLSSLQIY